MRSAATGSSSFAMVGSRARKQPSETEPLEERLLEKATDRRGDCRKSDCRKSDCRKVEARGGTAKAAVVKRNGGGPVSHMTDGPRAIATLCGCGTVHPSSGHSLATPCAARAS